MGKLIVTVCVLFFAYLLSLGLQKEKPLDMYYGSDESGKRLWKSFEDNKDYLKELEEFQDQLIQLKSRGDQVDLEEIYRVYSFVDPIIENRLNQFEARGSVDLHKLREINSHKETYKLIFGKKWIPRRLRTVSLRYSYLICKL